MLPGAAIALVVSLGSEQVAVPDIVGKSQASAESLILNSKLAVGTVTSQTSATAPIGEIIAQIPSAGEQVTPETQVDFVLSSGPVAVTVPEVVGQTQADAEAAIVASGLIVGTVRVNPSVSVSEGQVISQAPAGGTEVSGGSVVDLFVAAGDVVAVWTALDGPAPDTFEGVGTNEARWGRPIGIAKPGLRFDALSPPNALTIGTPFALGTLTHLNFVTALDTLVDGAELTITMALALGDNVELGPFVFEFDIEETSNFSNISFCPTFQRTGKPCDDRINFPSAFPSSGFFTIDGEEFTLEILGFEAGGETLASFITEERTASSAVLMAQFAPRPIVRGSALWVAESVNIEKFGTATGKRLFRIPEVGRFDALAVNHLKGDLWAAGGDNLAVFGSDGQPLFGSPLTPPVDPGSGNVELLAGNGTKEVWLGRGQQIGRYAGQADLLDVTDIPDDFRGLSGDTLHGQMWVATRRDVIGYDQTGEVSSILPLSGTRNIRDITYDPILEKLWLAFKGTNLRRYGIDSGIQELDIPFSKKQKISHLVPDYSGGVWVGATEELVKVDEKGQVAFKLKAFAGDAERRIIDLASDPVDGSVWVASKLRILNINKDGETRHELEVGEDDQLPDIHAITLAQEVLPPSIRFSRTQDRDRVNTNEPAIELELGDGGLGLDHGSLVIQANGEPLNVDCTFVDHTATCSPAVPLPEGLNTLVATIGDLGGNQSLPAQIQIFIDTVAPQILIDVPAGGFMTDDPSFSITGAVSEPATLTANGVLVPVQTDLNFIR